MLTGVARYLREQRGQEWMDEFGYIPLVIVCLFDESSAVVDLGMRNKTLLPRFCVNTQLIYSCYEIYVASSLPPVPLPCPTGTLSAFQVL